MEKRINRFKGLIIALLAWQTSFAQGGTEMADLMRANGKIYVVVAVIAIIFAGIVVYLVRIDNKTNHLEKELKNLQK